MSRIGRMPIAVPAGVTVDVAENNKVTVKGPKGTLERVMAPEMEIKVEGEVITVTPAGNAIGILPIRDMPVPPIFVKLYYHSHLVVVNRFRELPYKAKNFSTNTSFSSFLVSEYSIIS